MLRNALSLNVNGSFQKWEYQTTTNILVGSSLGHAPWFCQNQFRTEYFCSQTNKGKTTGIGKNNALGEDDDVVHFVQVERRSPQHHYRPRHTVDGAKMRASVRMTRYLESWGAAKPFANLHHRDSMTNENGKINTAVSNLVFTAHMLWLSKFIKFSSQSVSSFALCLGCANGAVSLPEEIRKASCSF